MSARQSMLSRRRFHLTCLGASLGFLTRQGLADPNPLPRLSDPARLLATLRGSGGSALALSPDGAHLITAGGKQARVWDAQTFQPIANPLVHADPVTSAAFLGDGSRVLTVSGDSVQIWDARTGAVRHLLSPGSEMPREHARVAPHRTVGARITAIITTSLYDAWAASDAQVVWRLLGGMLRRPVAERTIRQARPSPDGSLLAAACEDGRVVVWRTDTGEVSFTLTHHRRVSHVVFSPDGAKLLTIAATKSHVWDARTGEAISRGPRAYPLEGAFSPDGNRIATRTDVAVDVWDAATGKSMVRIPYEPREPGFGILRSLAFTPDGARLVAATGDRAWVWDATGGKPRELWRELGMEEVNAVVLDSTGRRLLLCTRPIFRGSLSRMTGIWTVSGSQRVTIPTAANSKVGAFGPAGSWVALGHPTPRPAGGDTTVWQVAPD